jgi:hypothetical protein
VAAQLLLSGFISDVLTTTCRFTLNGYFGDWRTLEFTFADSAVAPVNFTAVLSVPHSDASFVELPSYTVVLAEGGLQVSVNYTLGPIGGAVVGDTIWPQVFPDTVGASAPIASAPSQLVRH